MKTNPRLESNLPTPLKEHQLEDKFDDSLDNHYNHPECMGVTVEPHEFLKTHDETAYRCAFNDWLDSECRSDAIKEYDGSYYDKDDFDSAVADTIREVEEALDKVREEITAAQEKLSDFEEDDSAWDALTDKISDLDCVEDALDSELEELEDMV